mmetsp:Transcript_2297/g.3654  ORF Transcript_2297/g.3654 Transcript_2297/m.3654 type:complete len:125 (+) Transcript_2297:45-419(+)|eukprot:CAMPEP_0196813970 /NCGR_PEP_ID=MMETSP1362-20130617/40497_1 /TAXON_ID=163516 /ORGANISM="Leptocylindrus danicus, Strain CCMP1856" /LENGTH=124 /DNA_ID=CAMNT_0042190429 /DNA_START=29 /DNA_END=403 /DNA_ORIENTATION=+
MKTISALFLILGACSAFTVNPAASKPSLVVASTARSTKRFMFDKTDPETPPPAAPEPDEDEEKDGILTPKQFRTDDTKWVDNAETANVDFKLSWWGYVVAIYPIVLLLNDAFHFIPEDFKALTF